MTTTTKNALDEARCMLSMVAGAVACGGDRRQALLLAVSGLREQFPWMHVLAVQTLKAASLPA